MPDTLHVAHSHDSNRGTRLLHHAVWASTNGRPAGRRVCCITMSKKESHRALMDTVGTLFDRAPMSGLPLEASLKIRFITFEPSGIYQESRTFATRPAFRCTLFRWLACQYQRLQEATSPTAAKPNCRFMTIRKFDGDGNERLIVRADLAEPAKKN